MGDEIANSHPRNSDKYEIKILDIDPIMAWKRFDHLTEHFKIIALSLTSPYTYCSLESSKRPLLGG